MELAQAVVQDVHLAMRHVLAQAPTTTLAAPSASEPVPAVNAVLDPLQTRTIMSASGFNSSAILADQQEYEIQVIATTFSSCSVLAAVCAIYWFFLMRRNFRRDLILLLICGDLWKSFWFLVFTGTSLSRGKIDTHSSFCQASGYFLQVGIEACDMAILLMSLHMQLQIFPPKDSFLGHDGLYRIRHTVLAIWFILPNVLVSLAFINDHSAFVSQGGFCTLPIRPFWYRLALSWIPRYLIWMYILFVAVRIYRHVGFEFKVFGEEKDRSSSFGMIGSTSTNTNLPADNAVPMQRSQSAISDAAAVEKQAGPDDEIAPDDDDDDKVGPSTPTKLPSPSISRLKGFDPGRRQSVPAWTTPFTTPGLEHMEIFAGPQPPRSKSNPSSRRGSKQIAFGVGAEDFAHPPQLNLDQQHRASVSTNGSLKSFGVHSYDNSAPGLDTITEQKTKDSTGPPVNSAQKAMQKRRKAIQRQLRLLFIYPCVYLLMWVIPFVAHALNYSNHFAQHPVFPITALSFFSQVSMGSVDVVIFCWRERPWRHIPGSNGTFFGSFLFWRFAFAAQYVEQRRKSSAPLDALQPDVKTESSQNGLLNSLKRWSMSISTKTSPGKTTTSPRPSQASLGAAAVLSSPPPVRRTAPPMHRRQHSGGSGRRFLEAERAHERLAMERADYQQHRRSLNERRTSAISASLLASTTQEQQTSPSRKEWWDRHMSITTDDYHDTTPG